MSTNPLAQVLREPAGRAPYIPILGRVAWRLTQRDEEQFRSDPHVQAMALLEAAAALSADAITVGWDVAPSAGAEVVGRLRPSAGDRGVVACVPGEDVAGVRAYLEVGVDLIFLIVGDATPDGKLKIGGNAARHYDVPAILIDPDSEDAAERAAALGLAGAVGAGIDESQPGIVGGGLEDDGTVADVGRERGFFWTFRGEVPELPPEELAALGSSKIR